MGPGRHIFNDAGNLQIYCIFNPDGFSHWIAFAEIFCCRRFSDHQAELFIQGSFGISIAVEAPTTADLHLLQVTPLADPAAARLLRSFESGHTNVDQLDQAAARLNVQAEAVKMDSQAKYAVLAAGRGEAIVRLLSPEQPNYKEKIWDHAAGSLVVEEAGGRLSDLDGKPLDFTAGRTLQHNRGLLATNNHLHPAFLAALQSVGA